MNTSVNRKQTIEIMKKYNLEPIVDETFRRLKGLISLSCNDEGELPYDVEEYWIFAYGFCNGYLNSKKGEKI